MSQNKKNKKNNEQPSRLRGLLALVAWALILTIIFNYASVYLNDESKQAEVSEEIAYSDFRNLVKEDQIEEVKITPQLLHITPKDSYVYKDEKGNVVENVEFYTVPLNDPDLYPLLEEHGVRYTRDYVPEVSPILTFFANYILPFVLIMLMFSLFMRILQKRGGGIGGMGNVGKSNAKVYMEKSTGVTFKDVAGQDEAKESLEEIIDFLHNPGKYTAIGAKLPKGALLVGSPGTGKTLLAKAVAGEANVPFFSISGSDFVEMFVGVGASRVRDLFKEASKVAPCIIFIDEIDTIGKTRDSGRFGGNDEREQTLNQLLSELDGFDPSKGIIVLGATNRPEVLDKALLRPGRFDRRITVDRPNLAGRLKTLEVHTRNINLAEDVNLEKIAQATAGCEPCQRSSTARCAQGSQGGQSE